ncbi:MAG TPA: AAA family ATPase, partial [Anaerolineae bacterium]|nr:AAA family ATPase [Anaerolineae bacterium]
MAALSLSFLGPLTLRTEGCPLALPATQKACSLLAYLVLHHDHAYPREQLADLLWPDRPRDKALHNLSTALWHIRRILPTENYLLADTHTLQFDPASEYWLDVQEFESNLQEARGRQQEAGLVSLAACVKLYRGDLLEGFYDDWCLEERYRLEALYLNALDQLVTGYQSVKHFEEALQYAKLLLAHDPLREDMHCIIIRLQAGLGNQAEALHQARWCRAVLKAESNAEVSSEMAALCDGLFGSAWRYEPGVETFARPDSLRAGKVLALERPSLVGREHEWSELLAHWEKAQSPQGHVIFVKGEAGIGKSRLAQELTEYVRQSGGWVASGHCYEYERAMPYGLLVDLLRGALSITRNSLEHLAPWQMTELARLAPELEAPPATPRFLPVDQEQSRLFDALLFFLFDLAKQNPLLLIMEDMHWANDSTLAWFHYLARRLSGVPILLFATCRCEEVSDGHPLQGLVLQLEQQGLASQLELPRLSQGDLARWMENASARLVEQVYQRTAGNPFFILETLRALCEDGQAQWLAGHWIEMGSARDLPIPASVSQAVQLHLDRL